MRASAGIPFRYLLVSRPCAVSYTHLDVYKRQSQGFYDELWKDLITRGSWSGELWNRRKSGETYVHLQHISAVRDAQGRVMQYVAFFSDITAKKEQDARLNHMAHFDALTGLPNRLLYADRLQQAMAQVTRREQQLALALSLIHI